MRAPRVSVPVRPASHFSAGLSGYAKWSAEDQCRLLLPRSTFFRLLPKHHRLKIGLGLTDLAFIQAQLRFK